MSRLILFRIAMCLPRKVRQRLKIRFPGLAAFVIGIQIRDLPAGSSEKMENVEFILSTIAYNLASQTKHNLCSVAFFSPWPPNKSGIAWHGDKFIGELNKFIKVDVFVSGNQNRSGDPVSGVYPIEFYNGFNSNKKYCFRVFNIGNGPDHADSLRILQEDGGSVILHDVRVPAIPTRNPRSGGWKYGPFGDLGCDLFPGDTKMILHSEFAEKMLMTDPVGKELNKSVVPTGLPIYSVGNHRPYFNGVLGMVGFFSTEKQPEIVASAFGRLSSENPEFQFKFIGKLELGLKVHLMKIFEAAGGQKSKIEIHEDLNEQDYWREVLTLGLAVQLRDRTNGESSGTAHEIQAQGIPVVCTNIGANTELPGDAFIKVPRRLTGKDLASEIVKVINDKSNYASRSENGIEWAKGRMFKQYVPQVLNIIGSCPIHAKETPIEP